MKKRIGLYVDDANLYYGQKRAGWKIDYSRLLSYVSQFGVVCVAKYFIGMPGWEPAKGINEALKADRIKAGYVVITKPLKKIFDPSSIQGFINKCNFDVEITMEACMDMENLDKVYIASGDSDFVYIKTIAFSKGKQLEFMPFESNCAWEIKLSEHTFLDDIKDRVSKVNVQ